MGASTEVATPPPGFEVGFFGPARPGASDAVGGAGGGAGSDACEFQRQTLDPGCLTVARCGETVRSLSCDENAVCTCRENNVATSSITRPCGNVLSSVEELNAACSFSGVGGAGGSGGAGGGAAVDPWASCTFLQTTPGTQEDCRRAVGCGRDTFEFVCLTGGGCICTRNQAEARASSSDCTTSVASPRQLVESVCEYSYTPQP